MKAHSLIKYIIIALLFISVSTHAADETIGVGGDYPPTAAGIQDCCAARLDGESCTVLDAASPLDDLGVVTIDDTMTAITYLKAETAGRVDITGTTKFVISGDYWNVSGFIVKDLTVSGVAHYVFEITGDNVHITDNEFKDSGAAGNRPFAAKFQETADDGEFDYNYIHDWQGTGVSADAVAGDVSQNTHIHHNYFKTFPEIEDADKSVISLSGTLNTSSDQEMNAVVEYNVFDACRGDPETISVKNSNNTFRYNVFKNSYALSLRYGDDSLVSNNWFFRTDATVMTAIQISGKGHDITSNYFEGIDGSKVISFMAGTVAYEQIESCLFNYNIFAYCDNSRILQFGSGDDAATVTIDNNIIHNSDGGYIAYNGSLGAATTVTWTNNWFYTTGTYYDGTGPGGSWPADSSNADQLTAGEFAALFTVLTNDEYDDIYEADEVPLPDPLPISKTDVGPSWMNQTYLKGTIQ